MSFKIVIREVTREQVKTREWKITGKDDTGENTYGYVSDEKTEDVSREVYTQNVAELDLVSVINAVNKESK